MCVRVQTERLQALLADNEKVNLSEIEPIPLPLEPQIRIRGIVPETATLFKVENRFCLDYNQYLCNIWFMSLFPLVCVSECSDASQADLQSRGWSHVPSYLQTWGRPETGPAYPADHLAHGQSRNTLTFITSRLSFLPPFNNFF